MSGIGLLMSRRSAALAKHGKNGLASGVCNAFTNVGFMVQNYGAISAEQNSGTV